MLLRVEPSLNLESIKATAIFSAFSSTISTTPAIGIRHRPCRGRDMSKLVNRLHLVDIVDGSRKIGIFIIQARGRT